MMSLRFPVRRRVSPLSRSRAFGALLLGALLFLPGTVRAGFNPDVKMFVHLVPETPDLRLNCFNHGVSGYEDVVVHGEAPTAGEAPRAYLAYVLIGGFDTEQGITGTQFGIAYDPEPHSGIDVDGWQDCALYEWHLEDWPLAGTGNLLTWSQEDDCQKTEPLVVGFFHLLVYSPDRFILIKRPADERVSIAACGITSSNTKDHIDDVVPRNLGFAGFGTKQGYNPWDPKENGDETRAKRKKD